MDKKVFVLGLGCQKGGTTWLHRYLRGHPNTAMGIRKEYHLFDALHVPLFSHHRDKNVGKVVQLYHNKAHWLNRKNREKLLHAAFYADEKTYFDYFQSLVSVNNILLTGDLTPEYCGLPATVLARIKSELEARDFTVKVVFLLRDPVKRCISAMRMYRRKFNRFESSENDELLALHATQDFEVRTRYERTINVAEDVFAQTDIYYGFFEELFNDNTVKSLTDFLEIPYRKANFGKKINVDKSKFVIDSEVLQQVFDHYHATYDFVAKKFGSQRISELWPNYRKFIGTPVTA